MLANRFLHPARRSARVDRQDPDPRAVDLGPQTVGHCPEGVFRCRVGTGGRTAVEASTRVDEYQLPLPRYEIRQQRLGQQPGGPKIHRHLSIEVSHRPSDDASADEQAQSVYHDGRTAAVGGCFGNRQAGLLVGQVTAYHRGTGALRLEFVRQSGERLSGSAIQDTSAALGGEQAGYSATDRPTGTTDHGALVHKSGHGSPPRRSSLSFESNTSRPRQRLFGLLLGIAVCATSWTLPIDAQTRFIAFGDSITAGVGDSNQEPDRGYPWRLENLLRDAGRNDTVLNRGVGGENTIEGLARIDDVLAEGGDVLLLMEGTNDISNELSAATTIFNLNAMAQRAFNDGFTVVHSTLIPRIPRAKVDRDNILNQDLSQRIRDLAGDSSRFLVDPFHLLGAEPDRYRRLYQDVATDPVGHPNADGYDIVAQAFFDVIEGNDVVPPVVGITTPRNRAENVPANTEIRIELWDFGSGIDDESIVLTLNGQSVAAQLEGSGSHIVISYNPPLPLSGVIVVELAAADFASPANSRSGFVLRFATQGTAFLIGDINRDGYVDGADLNTLGTAFGSGSAERRYRSDSDLDSNKVVDGEDLALLAQNFGKSTL